MRPTIVLVLILSACRAAPTPQPAPSAAPAAEPADSAVATECESQLARCMTAWSQSAMSATECESRTAPSTSASAGSAAPKPVSWEPVAGAKEIVNLMGLWFDAANGDAIPNHKINAGGIRVEIKRNAKTSRTPFGLHFWAPRAGHLDAKTISGGCGLYAELHEHAYFTGFCRGYGHPAGEQSEEKIFIERDPASARIRVKIGDWVEAVLVREHQESE